MFSMVVMYIMDGLEGSSCQSVDILACCQELFIGQMVRGCLMTQQIEDDALKDEY